MAAGDRNGSRCALGYVYRLAGLVVDYLLPLAALAVICSMWVITAAQRLEVAEYMIYLLEAGAFGVVIPLILLAIGVVNVLYPSLICICVSFLMLVWLFLFKRKRYGTGDAEEVWCRE